MTTAVLIFTFSPVQSFITEARRAADLYVGSQILVYLAKAAAQAIGPNRLIYPAILNGRLPDDVPNVLVAQVDFGQAEATTKRAHEALRDEWKRLADTARNALLNQPGLSHDSTWDTIWTRQADHLWQVFWTAAPIGSGGYQQAYQEARAALDAVKRSRVFPQMEEPGAKDSLSGMREALHLTGQTAKEYWTDVARRVTAAKLRPNGRERLDAIGAVKRFCELADRATVSTSTIASADFRERARQKAGIQLALYRKAVEDALKSYIYAPRKNDLQWPYDGDLFFPETLMPERLEDSYHGVARPDLLERARQALLELYKVAEARPSPYYAIIVLDGDDMGKHISRLLSELDPAKAHGDFSRQLATFAQLVPQTLGATFRARIGSAMFDADSRIGQEFLVYNGGDDVLALAPLSVALPMAQALAMEFSSQVPGCTASAGLAVVHHLYPLDAALAAAREAEKTAKTVPGKAAIAVRVLKRSGETVTVRSRWKSMGDLFDELVGHFAGERLSSRFAYELSERAPVVTALPADARKAAIKQLVRRHKSDQLADPDGLVERLWEWAQELDAQTQRDNGDGVDVSQGFTELSRWTVFARFVAQGGGE